MPPFGQPVSKVPPSAPSPYPLTDCLSYADLNFKSACASGNPAQNNLGGAGPDAGPAEIRYSRVGVYNSRGVDLVLQAATPLTRFEDVGQSDVGLSGCEGPLGKVTIQAGSQVTLVFSFQDSLDRSVVALPSFLFSIFDVDGLGSEMASITGFSRVIMSNPTNLWQRKSFLRA